MKGRIFYLHAADNDGRVNEHLAPGRGTIDWDGLFTALKKHGFEGHVAVDVGGMADIEEQYQESKRFLERVARRVSLRS